MRKFGSRHHLNPKVRGEKSDDGILFFNRWKGHAAWNTLFGSSSTIEEVVQIVEGWIELFGDVELLVVTKRLWDERAVSSLKYLFGEMRTSTIATLLRQIADGEITEFRSGKWNGSGQSKSGEDGVGRATGASNRRNSWNKDRTTIRRQGGDCANPHLCCSWDFNRRLRHKKVRCIFEKGGAS